MRSKLSVTVYLFLALYWSTTIQSRWFLKNIKNFVWIPKQYLLGVFILEKQFADIPNRGFLFLRNTLLLYSLSPYRQTERQTEKWIHSLRVGWWNFFQLCCFVSFWFCQEIGFGLHTYALRVPYSCGVVSVFLVLAGNSFWYVHYHKVVVLW
jgi:hypothetical protein